MDQCYQADANQKAQCNCLCHRTGLAPDNRLPCCTCRESYLSDGIANAEIEINKHYIKMLKLEKEKINLARDQLLNYLLERLEKVEERLANPINFDWCKERIEKLENQLSDWECEEFYFKNKLRSHDSKPHECPVCKGKGKDKNKLIAEPYDQEIKIWVNPNCHACEGKGIVWG